MSTLEHSPLPWHIDEDGDIVDSFDHYVNRKAPNARLIVRAVNSHAELLAAAKASIELADKNVIRLDDGTPIRTPECQEIYDRVVASIAHAEESAS